MTMKIKVVIDTATEERLLAAAREMGRSAEDLAEAAISEAVLAHYRHRTDDPGRGR